MPEAYAEVDGVIDHWVKATGSTLFKEWAGEPARFFHLPGEPPFECFQVSIASPENGHLTVLARSIDTNDDAEMERTWAGLAGDLEAMLSAAVATIESWKVREQARGK